VGVALRTALWIAVGAMVPACVPNAADGVNVVTIRIEHSRFEPSSVEVSKGTTVRFIVRNSDPIDHEFIIGNERVQEVHENGTESHHGAKPGEITVPSLAQRSTTYSFEDTGRLIFGCHLPGHYAYGMRGEIMIR
jgi:uncharacterized cupredoxin-like copper-binding protein